MKRRRRTPAPPALFAHLSPPAAAAAVPGAARVARGKRAEAHGLDAESVACAALVGDGWQVLARRLRTAAGEIDVVAERDGLLAIVEVKSRPTLADAAWSLTARQRARLLAAAGVVLAENPGWGRAGVRFDLMLVDTAGVVRRVADAFRDEG